MNKNVQTGAKTQDGGLKDGFTSSVIYQDLTEEAVKKLPKIPMSWGIKRQRINLIRLNLVLVFTFIIKSYTI